jgi:hypothetical protein
VERQSHRFLEQAVALEVLLAVRHLPLPDLVLATQAVSVLYEHSSRILANKEQQHRHPQPHPHRTRPSPFPPLHPLAHLLDPVCLAVKTHRQAQTLRLARRYLDKKRKQLELRNPVPACLEAHSLRPAARASLARLSLAPQSQQRLLRHLRPVSLAPQLEVSL